MSDKISTSVNQSALLEQYLLLAKTAKGAAAVELIKQVLEVPGMYVFGELLDMANVQELGNGPNAPYLHLLNVFAYGTYANYLANQSQLPVLTPAMVTKLRHLTIVSLATKSKCIPYSKLLQELNMKNLRELEDLIIEVIYADVVRGKLDQKNNQLEVDYTIGRDIRPEEIGIITTVLQDWCDTCETVVSNIENQITRANSTKENFLKLKLQIETEVSNIKKTIKAQSQDGEEQMATELREAVQSDKPNKKQAKSKGIRGGKLWHKAT